MGTWKILTAGERCQEISLATKWMNWENQKLALPAWTEAQALRARGELDKTKGGGAHPNAHRARNGRPRWAPPHKGLTRQDPEGLPCLAANRAYKPCMLYTPIAVDGARC
jgi:hypothetical protein